MQYSLTQRNKIIQSISNSLLLKRFAFGNVDLFLNKETLVPHPDTFGLIQLAEEVLLQNPQIETVADVGTGSGFIAIWLAKKFRTRTFWASDISQQALQIAKKNVVVNGVNNIHFLHNADGIWLSEYRGLTIDFIISNPPFVGEDEFNDEQFLQKYPEVQLEPSQAIVVSGDKNGVTPFLEMVKQCRKTETVKYLFQANTQTLSLVVREIGQIIDCAVEVEKDQAGLERFLLVSV